MLEGLQMKYFILHPTKDSPYGSAPRAAMRAYAAAIDREDPRLSQDLIAWVERIGRDLKGKTSC